jgi:hypothetical protein
VSTAGGILTTEDSRLHIGSLVTPGSTNVKSRIGLRPGGSTAAASPGLVAAQSTPDKTVKINAFQAFMQTARGAGTYLQCLDVATNLDLLTAHPADPSLQRNDLIVAQQNDTTYGDGNNTWSVIQVVGTPSGTPADPTVTGSTDYYKLARVRVTAGATTITSGMIDDLRPPWAVALGGILPVKDATDRATLTPYEGMTIWRIDRSWLEIYSLGLSGWAVQDAFGSTLADIQANVTTPYNGQFATTTAGVTYLYYGGAWHPSGPLGVIGGQKITGSGNLGGAIGGTETIPTDMNSGVLSLLANRRYIVHVRMKYQGNTANDNFVINLYKNTSVALSGATQIAQDVVQIKSTVLGYTDDITATYETSAAENAAFFISASLTAVGSGTIQFQGGGSASTNLVGVWVEDDGPSGLLVTKAH